MKRRRPGRGHQWSTHREPAEGGLAAIELAIVLPLLVVAVVGAVEVSIAYRRQHGLYENESLTLTGRGEFPCE